MAQQNDDIQQTGYHGHRTDFSKIFLNIVGTLLSALMLLVIWILNDIQADVATYGEDMKEVRELVNKNSSILSQQNIHIGVLQQKAASIERQVLTEVISITNLLEKYPQLLNIPAPAKEER